MRALGLLTLAGLAVGGLGVELAAGGPAGPALLDLAAGWALLAAAAGLSGACRGLLGLAGAAWFLGTAAPHWGALYSAPPVLALLAPPAAWPRPRVDQGVAPSAALRGALPVLAASQ